MTETEIAEKLNVDQSTISRDIRALKGMSQQFVLI
jgi:IS30 family transposase